MKSAAVAITLSACASIVLPYFAAAQVAQSGYSLPLALAVEAATAAVDACAAKGWPVSAFVVDTSGVIKVHLKGDHSTIHTKDSAFRKAYTVVTMHRFSVSNGQALLPIRSAKIRPAPTRRFLTCPILSP
jgi:hypothetical protein